MRLTTERLLLRLFTPGDVEDMYAYERLESVNRYLYRPARDRAGCAEYIEKISQGTAWQAEGDRLTLAVCRREAPGVIGQLNITLASVAARQTEIGWMMHPDHGGRGYATEAARALAVHAFDALATHRLYARLDAENIASVRYASGWACAARPPDRERLLRRPVGQRVHLRRPVPRPQALSQTRCRARRRSARSRSGQASSTGSRAGRPVAQHSNRSARAGLRDSAGPCE